MKAAAMTLAASLFAAQDAYADDYVPPLTKCAPPLSHVVGLKKAVAWDAITEHLRQLNFSIDTADKSSGIIRITYAGDPEPYTDCGKMRTNVIEGNAERLEDYPASRAQITLQIRSPGGTVTISNTMALKLHGAIKLEEESEAATKISVRAKYQIDRTHEDPSMSVATNVVFSSATEVGSHFGAGSSIRCRPTWKFESEILNVSP